MAGGRVEISAGWVPGDGWCTVATLSYPIAGRRRTKGHFFGDNAADALLALVVYLRCGGQRLMSEGFPIDLNAVDTSACRVRFSNGRKRP